MKEVALSLLFFPKRGNLDEGKQVKFQETTIGFPQNDVFMWNEHKNSILIRARNNGRSTDNVRTDFGFDRSNFRLAGHVDRSKFNRIENEINLRFLLFSCFSCYLSSRCVLRNFDMFSC